MIVASLERINRRLDLLTDSRTYVVGEGLYLRFAQTLNRVKVLLPLAVILRKRPECLYVTGGRGGTVPAAV